ncbi:RHS repeat-associated core domain-containing protein [Microscilla marina]|uniref:RHS repeat-associated core domain-containing protein n=1 Tax=Microscilla marina ATCC 23134 TaxID=313606 RepID=A1ZYW4_MICM2|nr:RHS repeat-associated core domain-containing protein [Microscilla marina]EAY24400.1 hypothetical protein M23134_01740 [Microscilla marina ATCC 23134]
MTDQKRYLEDGGSFLEYANVRTFKNYYPFGMEQPGDEIDPMLIPVDLPDGWGIYEMTGWMGSIGLETELKVSLDYEPDSAKWVFGKDYASTPLKTYEVSFDVALDSLSSSDNELKVTIKDAATDQIIKEEVYKTAGNFKLRYLATGDTTKILFHLNDPTPNIGSSLEVTGIALNKTDFGDYRYGFNGKENDQEWGKLIQDYGFRLYNPAIGKFLSVDPLASEFPWNSTYAFAENKPIHGIDLEGAEFYIKIYSQHWGNLYQEALNTKDTEIIKSTLARILSLRGVKIPDGGISWMKRDLIRTKGKEKFLDIQEEFDKWKTGNIASISVTELAKSRYQNTTVVKYLKRSSHNGGNIWDVGYDETLTSKRLTPDAIPTELLSQLAVKPRGYESVGEFFWDVVDLGGNSLLFVLNTTATVASVGLTGVWTGTAALVTGDAAQSTAYIMVGKMLGQYRDGDHNSFIRSAFEHGAKGLGKSEKTGYYTYQGFSFVLGASRGVDGGLKVMRGLKAGKGLKDVAKPLAGASTVTVLKAKQGYKVIKELIEGSKK